MSNDNTITDYFKINFDELAELIDQLYRRDDEANELLISAETLADEAYCSLDPSRKAPLEVQRLVMQRLDRIAEEVCRKHDGLDHRVFPDEKWFWTGEWHQSVFRNCHVRAWTLQDAKRANKRRFR